MSHVTFKDGEWSVVYCNKCKFSHKLLTHKMQSDYPCPYCNEDIRLTSVFIEQAVKSAGGNT